MWIAHKRLEKLKLSHGSFDYGTPPDDEDVTRITKSLISLDNGTQYEGEWDE